MFFWFLEIQQVLDVALHLFILVIIIFIFSKEAILEKSKNSTKENCGKYDEGECCRHNNIWILEDLLVNLEHKTECNGSSDHSSEPNEDLLLECQFAIEFAESQE